MANSAEPRSNSWQETLRELEAKWLEKKEIDDELRAYLVAVFDSASHPYKAVLYLCSQAADYQWKQRGPNPKTLAFSIMKEFAAWIEPLRDKFRSLLTKEIKQYALRVSVSRNHIFALDLVYEVFELMAETELCYEQACQLIKDGAYQKAFTIITKNSLFTKFTVTELTLPLLATDADVKHAAAHLLACDNKDMIIEALKVLDVICFASDETKTAFLEKLRITPNRYTLNEGQLTNLLAKLKGKDGLGLSWENLLPNLTYHKAKIAIIFHLRTYYVEQSSSYSNMCAIVARDIEQLPVCIKLILETLTYNRKFVNFNHAARWVKKFPLIAKQALPEEWIPNELRDYLALNVDTDFLAADKEDILDSDSELASKIASGYLQLPPHVSPRMIDSRSSYDRFLAELEDAASKQSDKLLVGFDAETFQTLGLDNDEQKIALLQIAFHESVFLLDFPALMSFLADADWLHFIDSLFSNPSLLVIGFAFHDTDLKILRKALPKFSAHLESTAQTVICAQTLLPKLPLTFTGFQKFVAERYPKFQSQFNKFGLDKIVEYFFGLAPYKGNSVSNWLLRPLRPWQIHYAALDAYCLIGLFERMRDCAKNLGDDFEKCLSVKESVSTVPSNSSVDNVPEKKKRTSAEKKKAEKEELYRRVIAASRALSGTVKRPRDVRIVVDNALLGFGRQLRGVGIDCRLVGITEERKACFRYAMEENRVLLMQGTKLLQEAESLSIPIALMPSSNMSDANKQLEWVLKHFNVRVEASDLYSRCMVEACNSGEFVLLSQCQMKKLWDNLHPFINDTNGSASEAIEDAQCAVLPGANASNGIEEITVDLRTGYIHSSQVRVQAKVVARNAVDSIDSFYVCKACGKVYWDGNQVIRYRTSVAGVLERVNQAAKTSSETEQDSQDSC